MNSLIRQIQLLEAKLEKSILAIALTETADLTRAFTEGFKLFFTKPVEPVEVAATLASLSRRLP